ncbi:hypothetical protein [Kitasatospora sp. NPDC059599]|uniref:hypothetical protein n=1 Tax=Kitasatospora sp. NPDC059599 TaxID=3346880 RepID=UPI00369BC7F0
MGRRGGIVVLDGAMAALAAAVGSGVVQAAGTDAWLAFRNRLARLLSRADRQRESTQLERLDRTAAELSAAGPEGDGGEERAGAERARHGAAWRARVEDLLEELDPDERAAVAAELRVLLDEAAEASRSGGGGVSRNLFLGPTAVQNGDGNVQVNRFGSRP